MKEPKLTLGKELAAADGPPATGRDTALAALARAFSRLKAERDHLASQNARLREQLFSAQRGLAGAEPFMADATGDPGAPEPAPPSSLADVQREAIARALRHTRGRVSGPSGAAALLGLKPTTLESRMKKLGVRRLPPA